MFPIPDHLPRTGGDHLSSQSNSVQELAPDPTLDLLKPLYEDDTSSSSSNKDGSRSLEGQKASRWSSEQVKQVRGSLEKAVKDNKDRGHTLLKDNYPSVSSHIRLGDQVQRDFTRISSSVSQLEHEIDPQDAAVSFLPPVLATLNRHFTAHQAKRKAQSHVKALKSLSSQVERLRKLEDAIWAGRSADDWVVRELVDLKEDEQLSGTQIQREINARFSSLRAMVVEQLSDSFKASLNFTSTADGHTILTTRSKASLRQPKKPRHAPSSAPVESSKPPPYPLSRIHASLSQFQALQPLLNDLQTRIIRDIITSAASPSVRTTIDESESKSRVQLDASENDVSAEERIDRIAQILAFASDHVFPHPSGDDLTGIKAMFIDQIRQAALDIVLRQIILPAMPSTLNTIPPWLELIHHAVSMESKQSSSSGQAGPLIIAPFFDSEAGRAWAVQRRKRMAEEVRKIILGGWGGWEAVTEERDNDVVTMVEKEVTDDEADDTAEAEAAAVIPNDQASNGGPVTRKNGATEEEDFGWGFDDEQTEAGRETEKTDQDGDTTMATDDGWGFDDAAEAGPSKSSPKASRTDQMDQSEGDGWDFEIPAGSSKADADSRAMPPPPVPIAKPAREAKRLGKKVAKVKHTVDDDPWGSGSESVQSSTVPPSPARQEKPTRSGPIESKSTPPRTEDVAPVDDWAWGDNESATAPPSKAKKRKKMLKEEKKTIKETFLISRACAKIVDIAERTLREANDLQATDLLSPSFATAHADLFKAATDVFDIYRSLLPTHFASQLRDVPTLAMQLHNDARHLATQVRQLSEQFPQWQDSASFSEAGDVQGPTDTIARLNGLADHAFERQLGLQRDALLEGVEDAKLYDVGRDAGLKNAERALGGVVHNLDSLSRVLKDVLPATTYLVVLGYVLDETIQRITSDILGLQDITEAESTRLSTLLGVIYPLEEIFVLEPGQPSTIVAQVPHWLKFCYVSELLNANLVDILYLFNSGALIDFTTEELVSLIRALFADSEKRDKAIETIERGLDPASSSANFDMTQ